VFKIAIDSGRAAREAQLPSHQNWPLSHVSCPHNEHCMRTSMINPGAFSRSLSILACIIYAQASPSF